LEQFAAKQQLRTLGVQLHLTLAERKQISAVLHFSSLWGKGATAMTHGLLADKRILIVEDEHIIALDLADEITAQGAKAIGPVTTVNSALDVIANADLDGVILDINLRGEMAFPVADVLANRHIPFVFVTGAYIDTPDVPARHVNVNCISKPARSEVVCQALEAAIVAAQVSLP
jgi:CheY-like chemotaxis protein